MTTTVDRATAVSATREYFDGDDLATNVAVSKYLLRHGEEYLEKTPEDMHRRLAREFARIEAKYGNGLSEDEIYKYFDHFREIVPQGSPMFGIGNNEVLVSLSNCTVLGDPSDSMSSIMDTAKDMANLYKRRAGTGCDLSSLRPEGSLVNNAARSSTGAWSFSDLFSLVSRLVGQGDRRGALILTMSVKHPDIFKFITMKHDLTKVTGANISVRITDDFMQAVQADADFVLQFPVDSDNPTVRKTIRARLLWDEIVFSATKTAEPGLLFWDAIIKNLPAHAYPGFKTVSTNPCCFDKEYPVPVVTDHGVKNLTEVLSTDKVWVDDEKAFVETSGYFDSGEADVFEVILRNGRKFRVTENHKFSVYRKTGKNAWDVVTELVPLNLLKVGSRVQCHTESVPMEGYGEGSYDEGVTLFSSGESCYARLADAVNPWAGRSKEFIRGYLAAYFSSEAFFIPPAKTHSWIVRLEYRGKRRLENIREALVLFGVQSRVKASEYLDIIEPERAAHLVCRFIIDDFHSLRNLVRNVGFVGTRKTRDIVKYIATAGSRPPHAKPPHSAIVSIEKKGKALVGCLEVPGFHRFTAGGIVSGNSEIPLSPYDSCRLISINLVNFVDDAFKKSASFDVERFKKTVRAATRLSDDLVDLEIEKVDRLLTAVKDPSEVSLWSKFRATAVAGRRVGLGTHGLADCFARARVRYDSETALEMTDAIYSAFRDAAYEESINLADERGVFPVFSWDTEKDNAFISRLPEALKTRLAATGRRNISLLTLAPTGSVSICSKTSSGMEPVFRNAYTRRRKLTDGASGHGPVSVDTSGDRWEEYEVVHPNVQLWRRLHPGKELPEYFVESDKIDWEKRLEVQAVAQQYIDHSISCTINLPRGTAAEVVSDLYMRAWTLGLKGVTVYVDGSRSGVLVTKDQPTVLSSTLPPKRPEELVCDVHQITVHGNPWVVFVGLMKDSSGKELPYEIFAGESEKVCIPKRYIRGRIVKRPRKTTASLYDFFSGEGDDELKISDIVDTFGNDTNAAFTRIISLSLRHGAEACFLCEQLQKDKSGDMFSFSRVIGRVLKKYIPDGTKASSDKVCGSCGQESLVYKEGCVSCCNCGWSRCQ